MTPKTGVMMLKIQLCMLFINAKYLNVYSQYISALNKLFSSVVCKKI